MDSELGNLQIAILWTAFPRDVANRDTDSTSAHADVFIIKLMPMKLSSPCALLQYDDPIART